MSGTGGSGTYTAYAVSAGALPTGLSLNTGTGAITGTPSANGAFSFTLSVTDNFGNTGSQAYSVTTAAASLTVTPASLPGGTRGVAYSQTIGATGGSGTYSNFAVTTGALPAGLTLNATTGALTGSPTTVASSNFTVTVTDNANNTGSKAYTVAVAAATLGLTPATLPNATFGTAYSQTVSGTGGSGTYTAYAVSAGALPTGLSLNTTSGAITGTPSANGNFSFTVTATDSFGNTGSQAYSVTTAATTLTVTPASLPGATRGVAYSQTIGATGGSGTYSNFAVTTGALPAGLTLNATTGALTGTPTTVESSTFTVTVTDNANNTGSANYVLPVATPAPPVAASSTSATVPAHAKTEAGQNVNISLTSLVSGEYDEIRIVTQPQHGSVTILRTLAMRAGGTPTFLLAALAISSVEIPSEVIAVYTPNANYQGPDSFQFVAVGPGGTSAPATVAIQVVGRMPAARAQTTSTIDGQPVSVELTTGATDGPFIDATLGSVSPADQATVKIIPGGTSDARTFRMEATPKAHFGGALTISYTLTNAFGTSTPALVTINVTARPNPAADPVIQAVSIAQAEATRRFSRAQVFNFMRRAESLHGADCGRSANGLRVSSSDARNDQRLPDGADDTAEGNSSRQDDRPRRADQRKSDGDPSPTVEQCESPVAVWAGGTIEVGTRDALSGRSKISATTAGISVGADANLAQGVIVGIGAGIGHDSSNIMDGKGHVVSDTKVVALYGSVMPFRGLFIDGMVAQGWLDFDTRRIDTTSSLQTIGNRDGQFTTGALSAGIDRTWGLVQWSLYGRGEYLTGKLNGHRENGAGIYDLQFDDRDVRSVTGALGFKAAYRRNLPFGFMVATLRGEWQHEFTKLTNQGVDYADVSGASFYSLNAQDWGREQFTLAPGIELILPWGWEFGFDVGIRAAGGERAVTTSVQISKKF